MICPKCKSKNIECDIPAEPFFFAYICNECEFEFCYDGYKEEYLTINGGKL